MQTKKTPPILATRLLLRFINGTERKTIINDLYELYDIHASRKPILYAWLWYWSHVFITLFHLIRYDMSRSTAMIKNFFIVSYRSLTKNKLYSLINILGLSAGLTCCTIVLLFIYDEFDYDRFHNDADQIYRIACELTTSTGRISRSTFTRAIMAEDLKKDYPEIIDAVRFQDTKISLRNDEGFSGSELLLYTDPSFLTMFTFPFIRGDATTAINNVNDVVVTKEIAIKYFGTVDCMGKTLKMNDERDLVVTGILDDHPNTHLNFRLLTSFATLKSILNNKQNSRTLLFTYLKLRKDVNYRQFEQKIHEYIERKYGTERAERYYYYLQPIKSIHLYSNIELDKFFHSDIKYTYYYGSIALIVLLIACINFMNLTTARSIRRSKEVGLRKVIGARKGQLIRQFIGESVLLSVISMLFAIVLVYFFLPYFNDFTNKELSLDKWGDPFVLLVLLLIVLITGLISGIYPAFYLSAFNVADIIKSVNTQRLNGILVRKILVVIQFSLSLIFIISTIFVFRQIEYIRTKDLGYDMKNVITIYARGVFTSFSGYESIRNELLQYPIIKDITAFHFTVGQTYGKDGPFTGEGFSVDESIILNWSFIGYDYFRLLDIPFIDGRSFSREFSSDVDDAIIINESTAKFLGWENPIGKHIEYTHEDIKGKIIGIVKDYHAASLHQKIKPMVFKLAPDPMFLRTLAVRYEPGKEEETLELLKNRWHESFPDKDLNYSFLEERLDSDYSSELRTIKVYYFATLLSIMIACLGLYGLVSFSTENRANEIGIRKVLGASVARIVNLLTKEFILLVILANLISWPIAYIIMNKWFSKFAYRIELNTEIFVLSGVVLFIIVILTVGFQTIKTAFKNPVDSLRYE